MASKKAAIQNQAERARRKADVLFKELVAERDLILKGLNYRINPRRPHRRIRKGTPSEVRKAIRKCWQETRFQLSRSKTSSILIRQKATSIPISFGVIRFNQEQIAKVRSELPGLMSNLKTNIDALKKALDNERSWAKYVYGSDGNKRPRQKSKTTKRSPRRIEMSDEEKKNEATKLLGQLEKSADQMEKRKIRAQLRDLGHKGGLGHGQGRKAKPKTKAKAKGKKGKRAKKTKAA